MAGAMWLASVRPAVAVDPSGVYTPIRLAVHIHTEYSTGHLSLAEVVDQARRRGLDALIVTDDDLLDVAYGLPPWRNLLHVTRHEHSLLGTQQLQAYLSEIRRLDAAYDDLIVIDGVESAPYYYWDTNWTERTWTVRNWNKHLAVVGLGVADAYRALPIIGGPSMWRRASVAERVARILWPLVGLLYALWLGRGVHGRGLRATVGVVCVLFFVDGALVGFRQPLFSPYGDRGAAPYQAYIDAAARLGGLAFWTHPEASSTIPPMSVADGLITVRSVTRAHASDLVDTRDYTGFAALYADNITATEPGREWDRVLVDYLRDRRRRPVWGTGEIDFHGYASEHVDDIQTVLLVTERSRAGVLAALARGRGYAVRGGTAALRLATWSVAGSTAVAVAGQEVTAGDGPCRVRLDLDKVSGQLEKVRVRLVRGDEGGHVEVVAEVDGSTPIHLEHEAVRLAPGRRCYYRLLARSRTSILTSNPIFVRGGGAAVGE